MRVAVQALRIGNAPDEQFKQLRSDLDLLREENRKLKRAAGSYRSEYY